MNRGFPATGTLLVAGMLTVMHWAAIAPSLPAIAEHFAAIPRNEFLASLILVMPALGITLAAPFTGWVADSLGRWQTLAGAVALFMLSGASGYAAPDYATLLGGRFLLGCAIAGISTSTTSLLGALPEEDRRQNLLGKQSAFINIAGMTYLLLGGWLAAVAHWRIPFLLFLWPALLLPFIYAGMKGHSPRPRTEGVRAQGSLRTFLRGPLMPVTMFIWMTGFAIMLMLYTAVTILPFWLQDLGIEDARLVSVTIMAGTLSSAITGWNFRRLSRRAAPHTIFGLTFLLFGAGLFIIAQSHVLWQVMAGMLVLGVGMGLPVPNGSAWISSFIPDGLRGRALGVFTTCVFVGQFLSPAIIDMLNTNLPGRAASYILLGGICLGMAVLTVIGARCLLSRWAPPPQE